jgi:hypothetical protein
MADEILNVNWDEKKKRLVDLLEPLAVAYMYVLAALSPVLGLILGIVALKKCELESNKKLGKNVLVISIIMLGVWALCFAAYIVVIVMVSMKGGSGGFKGF